MYDVMNQALADRLAQLSPAKRALFEQLQGSGNAEPNAASALASSGPAPLSFAQERLWFLDQLEPGNPFYNVATSVRLRGTLDAIALERTLLSVIERHQALRTRFELIDGVPKQVTSPASFRLERIDLVELSTSDRERRLQDLATEESLRPFDLAVGPLIRATLVRSSEREHTLLLTLHHIVCDGWSMAILKDEIAEQYAAHVEAREPRLAPLATHYTDFAIHQRAELQGTKLERLLDYWSRELVDLPGPLELPADRPRPAMQSYRGDVCRLRLEGDLTRAVRELATSERATPYMVLLAAWQILLGRWSRRRDVAVGTPIAQRGHRDLEPLVGFFVNMLVMRGRFEDDPSFREYLDRVRSSALGAFSHQDLPFARLVEHLQPPRDPSRAPLVQVMFVMQNIPVRAREAAGLVLEETSYDHAPVSHFDLTLNVEERSDALHMSLVFNPDLYERATIERMLASYRTLLESITAEPESRVSKLTIVTSADRRRQLVDLNRTGAALPKGQTLHELFVAQAQETPNAAALCLGEEQLTYGELDRASNRLARTLVERGVSADVPVGICLDRSFDLVIAMLAIMKAGGAYVPLDPAYPPQRRTYMIDDAGLKLVLTRQDLATGISHEGCDLLLLDVERSDIDSLADDPLPSRSGPANLAYVIYTSGSTGEPKGVDVEHRGLANHAVAFAEKCQLGPGDRLMQYLSPSFDAAAEEIFPTLACGATLCLHTSPAELSGRSLLDWSRAAGVTVLHLPVAVWTSLVAALSTEGSQLADHLRLVIAGGDNVPRGTLRRWRELTADRIRFLFAYGVTEATITSALFDGDVEPATTGGDRTPIGRPLANHRLYILDEHARPVPLGVAGEIAIGGIGVARGYRGRPALTAERFAADPFAVEQGGRLYRTGDLGRYLADGNIEFLGRIDQQVKIRGFRIEPGEIEAALTAHARVREAIVVPLGDGETRRLAAYVGCSGNDRPTEAELHEFLAKKLPGHMLPSAITVLPRLPRLAGAKVDVASLPAPSWGRTNRGVEHVAPRDEIETALAAIWSEVLGVEQPGIHDNFFDLGGDSIRTIQVVARAGALGLRITPKQFLERQTIADLALVVGQAPAISAEQGPITGPVPLLPIQQEFFALQFAEQHHFNQSVLLDIDASLTRDVLSSAVRGIVTHHDVLRMRYRRDADGTWQQTCDGLERLPALEHVELAGVEDGELPGVLAEKCAEVQAGLELASGPLARFVHFDLGRAQRGRLLIVVHHLAIDAVSWRIVLEDLNLLCEQLQQRQPPRLPPKTTAYRDWGTRLAQLADDKQIQDELANWLDVPTDQRNLPCEITGDAASVLNTVGTSDTVRVTLDEATTQSLLGESQAAYRTRPQDLMLAALADVVTDFSGDDAVRINLEGHGRETPADDMDLSRTVGWFTSLYPVTLRRAHSNAPRAWIQETKELLRGIPAGGLSYGVLRWLASEESVRQRLADLPRPEVCFNYLGQFDHLVPVEALLSPTDEPHGPDHSPRGARAHLWEINAYVRQGKLVVEWTYSTAHHRRETIERLAAFYLDSLGELVAHCLAPEAGGATPSDFPLADVDQDDLDQLAALFDR